jgi:Phospholipase_D-nuclease N-terminal
MDFWEAFGLLIILSPILLVWIFGLVDLFRRHDLRPLPRVLWLLAIVIFPVFGTFLYFCFRPGDLTKRERDATAAYVDEEGTSRTEQLRVITQLHNAGKLTTEEYEEYRQHTLQMPR